MSGESNKESIDHELSCFQRQVNVNLSQKSHDESSHHELSKYQNSKSMQQEPISEPSDPEQKIFQCKIDMSDKQNIEPKYQRQTGLQHQYAINQGQNNKQTNQKLPIYDGGLRRRLKMCPKFVSRNESVEKTFHSCRYIGTSVFEDFASSCNHSGDYFNKPLYTERALQGSWRERSSTSGQHSHQEQFSPPRSSSNKFTNIGNPSYLERLRSQSTHSPPRCDHYSGTADQNRSLSPASIDCRRTFKDSTLKSSRHESLKAIGIQNKPQSFEVNIPCSNINETPNQLKSINIPGAAKTLESQKDKGIQCEPQIFDIKIPSSNKQETPNQLKSKRCHNEKGTSQIDIGIQYEHQSLEIKNISPIKPDTQNQIKSESISGEAGTRESLSASKPTCCKEGNSFPRISSNHDVSRTAEPLKHLENLSHSESLNSLDFSSQNNTFLPKKLRTPKKEASLSILRQTSQPEYLGHSGSYSDLKTSITEIHSHNGKRNRLQDPSDWSEICFNNKPIEASGKYRDTWRPSFIPYKSHQDYSDTSDFPSRQLQESQNYSNRLSKNLEDPFYLETYNNNKISYQNSPRRSFSPTKAIRVGSSHSRVGFSPSQVLSSNSGTGFSPYRVKSSCSQTGSSPCSRSSSGYGLSPSRSDLLHNNLGTQNQKAPFGILRQSSPPVCLNKSGSYLDFLPFPTGLSNIFKTLFAPFNFLNFLQFSKPAVQVSPHQSCACLACNPPYRNFVGEIWYKFKKAFKLLPYILFGSLILLLFNEILFNRLSRCPTR